jgi:hypothetical protein
VSSRAAASASHKSSCRSPSTMLIAAAEGNGVPGRSPGPRRRSFGRLLIAYSLSSCVTGDGRGGAAKGADLKKILASIIVAR